MKVEGERPIVVDAVTGVNYLLSAVMNGVSEIIPLLDEKGNVVIDR